MFKNYIKTSIRNINGHKGFSFINITGLAVGMTVCMLLLQYVTYEQSYDDFHENGDNIYRLRLTNFAASHGAAGRAVKHLDLETIVVCRHFLSSIVYIL